MLSAFFIIVGLVLDLVQWCGLLLRPRESFEAENLFLRRQLALYQERGVKPKRVDAATRVTLRLCRDVSIGVVLLWWCGRRR